MSQTKTDASFAPEVRGLIEQVKAAQERHSNAMAEWQSAVEELHKIEGELKRLEADITRRDIELARVGASLPEELFPEEVQAESVKRHMRMQGVRVGLHSERLTAAAAELKAMQQSLYQAFIHFGRDEYAKAREEFRTAALELVKLHMRLCVWPEVFFGRGPKHYFPGPPRMTIENPTPKNREFLLIDFTGGAFGDVKDESLLALLGSLRSEVLNFSGVGVAPFESKGREKTMSNNTQIHQENIPTGLNSPGQTRANAQDQHAPKAMAGQPINVVPGSQAGCDTLSKAANSLTGEAATCGQSQLNAHK